MDETLKQILHEISKLAAGQTRLEGEVRGIRTDLDGVKKDLAGVKDEVQTIRTDLDGVKKDLAEVKELGKATFEQVGVLIEFRTEMNEFRTETNARLDRIDTTLTRHNKMIDHLAARSVEQEADIAVLSRAK